MIEVHAKDIWVHHYVKYFLVVILISVLELVVGI